MPIHFYARIALFISPIAFLTSPALADDDSDLDLAIFEKYNIFYEPPAPKTKPLNTPKSTYFKIRWVDKSDNESQFIIERRTKPNKAYTTTYYAPANSTSFNDSKIEPNKTYCYRVSSSNVVGKSPSPENCITFK